MYRESVLAMAENRLFVGVDVGGTKILSLLVTEEGEVLQRFKQSTRVDGTPLSDQVGASLENLLAAADTEVGDLAGVGIAVPGVVDRQRQVLVIAPNLGVENCRLVEELAARFPVPTIMDNDANLGTLAEVWLGAARGAESVVGVFVGTGIGGGLVYHGDLITGAGDMGGEIGHMVIQLDGPECGCGNLGCWEALASRTAVDAKLRRAIEAGRDSVISEAAVAGRIKSGALAAALEEDDELVVEVMKEEAHYLAQGLLSLRHVFDPQVLVLGGGVMEACADFLMPLIEQEVGADKLIKPDKELQLVVASLEDDSVALGAAGLARSRLAGIRLWEAPQEPETHHLSVEEFGKIVVDGQEYAHDLAIRADGKIRRRRKSRARKDFGTSHVLGVEELSKLTKGDPETVIIGAGHSGMVRLSAEAEEFMNQGPWQWRLLPTSEAAHAYNEIAGPKALLIHVTC
jgi:glucokinase